MTAADSSVLVDSEGRSFEMRSIACPVCGPMGEDVLGLRGGSHQRWGLGVETRIVRCRSCRLVYPNPFPFPQDPQQLYGDPEKYFAVHDLDTKIRHYQQVVRGLQRRTSLGDPRTLDIGAGRGDFLRAAQLEGVSRFTGLEFSSAMVEFAHRNFGITLSTDTLEEMVSQQRGPFDVVVLNGVLEHVYNPDAMVRCISQLSRPGTWLYVDVPHDPNLLTTLGNLSHRLRGRSTVMNLSPTWSPYHVFGFTRGSLAHLLNKHGFEVDKVRVHATPEIRSNGGLKDRLAASVGTQINRLANLTQTASNMRVWARYR